MDVRGSEAGIQRDRPVEGGENRVLVDTESGAVAKVPVRVAQREPDLGVRGKGVARSFKNSKEAPDGREVRRISFECDECGAHRVGQDEQTVTTRQPAVETAGPEQVCATKRVSCAAAPADDEPCMAIREREATVRIDRALVIRGRRIPRGAPIELLSDQERLQ